ncbi:MAG: hypothetical protein HYT81_06345 [Gemmatimonadetes bacterium]|nr:hypothetical protein [Gemmatimonadota bacterium]
MVSLFGRQRAPEDRGVRVRRWAAGAGFSVVAHLAVILLLLAIATEPPRSPRVLLIPWEVGTPENRVTPYLVPAPAGRPAAVPRTRPTTGLGAQVLPEPQPVTRPSVREAVQPAVRVPRPDSAGPLVVVAPRTTTRRLLRPGYGDGRLWVPPIDVLQLGRPLPAAPARGAEGPPTVAQLDSTVTARLRAFLDTMPPDSFAPPSTPSWTTEIAGRTWGIDGKWIYLGGLKLPAALLALLPFPQGNIDQSRAAMDLMRYREDIMQAAQRAETAAEFKRYVNELRKRKDQERELKKKAARDTVIP